MKKPTILLFLLFLSLSPKMQARGENPFMRMAGQAYAEYSDELYDRWFAFNIADSLAELHVLDQLRETAVQTKSLAWELELIYFEITSRMRRLDEKRPIASSYPEELDRLSQLAERAKKGNILPLLLKSEGLAITCYWRYAINYERAFEHCENLGNLLEDVSGDSIPEKALYYQQIADCYYHFQDYETAINYYRKILAEKETIRNQNAFVSAHNGLGLCYRGMDDLALSDKYFYSILGTKFLLQWHEEERYVWDGIAEGNIAENLFLRGKYDEAIPWFESSMEKVLRHKLYPDYAFAASPAIHLAEIWLMKGELSKARHYIDLAMDYNRRMPRAGRQVMIYKVTGKYYAAAGNARLCAAYMDSALIASEQYSEEFDVLQLMRAKQRISLYEQQLKEEELHAEKVRNAAYRKYVDTVSIGMLFIFILLLTLFVMYRKKRLAYRELVRQNRRWAAMETITIEPSVPICTSDQYPSGHPLQPDMSDQALMKRVDQMVTTQKLYTDPDLTLDTLASYLQVNRNYISHAVNRCTGKNFSTYINEFRTKEAIRLLSEESSHLSVDGIAFDVGFSDRTTFSRVFKKITGLSPTAFRSNLQEK